jgi:hypothetical protein
MHFPVLFARFVLASALPRIDHARELSTFKIAPLFKEVQEFIAKIGMLSRRTECSRAGVTCTGIAEGAVAAPY